MTCESCAAADIDPRTGLFHANCQSCKERQLAHSLAFHVWRARGSHPERFPKEYAKAIKSITPATEEPETVHGRVKEWAKRIKP